MSKVKSSDEVNEWLKNNLTKWNLENNKLIRIYETGSWQISLLVTNTIGFMAEAAWHHPDLVVSYSQVKIKLFSHDKGGITERDFELAKKIEENILWIPRNQHLSGNPKWKIN
ncbi:MAG: 4a-hydroxytetrahydrobiopterin dehydratase [Candidatus Hodarchaeales archaeon]|jgi:4a-hydroxytetrahydrobiopterin dehydratase